VALRLFLAVWLTVATTAAVTDAGEPKPPGCKALAHVHPTHVTDAAGRRHYACAQLSHRPR
jgi:hypothetical protein